MKKPQLIGASQGWGAGRHETAWGPKALLDADLIRCLQKENKHVAWCQLDSKIPYTTNKNLSYSERLAQVQDFSSRLANELQARVENYFPIILGGDHSIAIGTWSGIICAKKAQSNFGLIWIDAHMDAHTPQTTSSHNLHGMPLAVLLGYGESDLVNLCANGAKLNPQHLVLIGVRSFENEEAQFLKKLNVTVYFMDEVKTRGFNTVFQEAQEIVTKNTKGFGLSIDIDAFDPLIAPGTGVPEPDGIQDIESVTQVLKQLRHDPHFCAIEIAEFDPTKDKQQQTQNLIKKLILSSI
ncbi:MAG: arginase [Proteobacteria bacterium]|nr:arginase [Pseudomonadota bacterium]